MRSGEMPEKPRSGCRKTVLLLTGAAAVLVGVSVAAGDLKAGACMIAIGVFTAGLAFVSRRGPPPIAPPPVRFLRREPLAVIDVETTGLSPKTERVIEIGVALFDGGELTGSFSTLLRSKRRIHPEAEKAHGITSEMLADAPTFADVFDELSSMLAGRIPVAYNADFDRSFLDAEFARLKRTAPVGVPAFDPAVDWIDPLVWARALGNRESSKRLGHVAASLGIPVVESHRARADAETAGRVLMALSPHTPADREAFVAAQCRLLGRTPRAWAAAMAPIDEDE